MNKLKGFYEQKTPEQKWRRLDERGHDMVLFLIFKYDYNVTDAINSVWAIGSDAMAEILRM